MKPSRHSSQSTPGGRRGGSRRRSDGPRSPRSSSAQANGSPKTAPTFWQKIASIFTGGRKPAPQKTAPEKVSTHPTTLAAARRAAGAGSNNANGGAEAKPSSPRLARKPEMVEVITPRLYVGNLSFDAAENDLTELFKGVGQVASVEVVSHKQTQRSKGFAFVQMQSVEEAKRAVEELHDKEFMGRKLVVSGAKNGDQHDGRSEPRFAA